MVTNGTTHQSDEIDHLQEIFATLCVQLRAAERRLQALNRAQGTESDSTHPGTTGSSNATDKPPRDRNGQVLHTRDKVTFSATKITQKGSGTISRFALNNTRVFIICHDNGNEIQRAPHNVQLLLDS